jgi:hypothetical protein
MPPAGSGHCRTARPRAQLPELPVTRCCDMNRHRRSSKAGCNASAERVMLSFVASQITVVVGSRPKQCQCFRRCRWSGQAPDGLQCDRRAGLAGDARFPDVPSGRLCLNGRIWLSKAPGTGKPSQHFPSRLVRFRPGSDRRQTPKTARAVVRLRRPHPRRKTAGTGPADPRALEEDPTMTTKNTPKNAATRQHTSDHTRRIFKFGNAISTATKFLSQ